MSLQAKDLYAALMHELKNNLGLLTLAMERIPRQTADEENQPLDEARLMCRNVVERLRQSLLLYKATEHGLPIAIDAYSPHEFVAGMRDEALSLTHGRVSVETSVEADVPPIWFFDRNLVDIALNNAIHNSLTYARERIVIRAEMVDGMLAFSVIDDSPGYPAHILEAQSGDETDFGSGGTGLGLELSHMIAESHKNKGRSGELRLANVPGAAFTLLLP